MYKLIPVAVEDIPRRPGRPKSAANQAYEEFTNMGAKSARITVEGKTTQELYRWLYLLNSNKGNNDTIEVVLGSDEQVYLVRKQGK